MPSAGLSIQCAQIFWTPVYNLVEYQCVFCLDSFLEIDVCLAHLSSCPKNGTNDFDNFPVPDLNKRSIELIIERVMDSDVDETPTSVPLPSNAKAGMNYT